MTRSSTTTRALPAEDVNVHQEAAAGDDLLAAPEETAARGAAGRARGARHRDDCQAGGRAAGGGHCDRAELPAPDLDPAALGVDGQRPDRQCNGLLLRHETGRAWRRALA